jgi:heme exporter protein D
MSGMGVIEGGWEFVWAAYGVTAAAFLGYGASLVLRFRAEAARAAREAQRSEVSS